MGGLPLYLTRITYLGFEGERNINLTDCIGSIYYGNFDTCNEIFGLTDILSEKVLF